VEHGVEVIFDLRRAVAGSPSQLGLVFNDEDAATSVQNTFTGQLTHDA
jgi:hypothetical protein